MDVRKAYYKSQEKEEQKEKLTAKNYIANDIFMFVVLSAAVGLAGLIIMLIYWSRKIPASLPQFPVRSFPVRSARFQRPQFSRPANLF